MPIISIAFYMVLIRIAMRRKNTDHVSASLRGMVPIESHGASNGRRGLQVHISQFSRTDSTALNQFQNRDVERDPPSLTHKGESPGSAFEA